jgi:hypothetical protein
MPTDTADMAFNTLGELDVSDDDAGEDYMHDAGEKDYMSFDPGEDEEEDFETLEPEHVQLLDELSQLGTEEAEHFADDEEVRASRASNNE